MSYEISAISHTSRVLTSAVRCGFCSNNPISPKKSPGFKYATTISRSSSSRKIIETEPFKIKYSDFDSEPASIIVERFGKRLMWALLSKALTDSGS
ncbi:hypothetical protein D3C75_804720 [compost metagenome]